MWKKILFGLAVVLLAMPSAFAAEPQHIISNSADWHDVYSTILYANLIDKPSNFLVSSKHGQILIDLLNKDNKNIQVISSTKVPYVVGYKSQLEGAGFNAEELRFDNVNLELAKMMDINNYIVVDGSYGYNSISVAPYAVIKKSYVLFADKKNINQVYSFLKTKKVNELILYGQVDREVKNSLDEFNPRAINTGDRFDDNIEIVKLYQEEFTKNNGQPKKQAILSNGEFIEQEIMSGTEPVLFIGRSNVPDQTREYIQNSGIEVGVLIGNELVGTATFVRRQVGISVFVKFAQSARNPAGSISSVEDLDRFYLPQYSLEIDLYSIIYNPLSKKIEVTYLNKIDRAGYLKGTITINDAQGTQIVGDMEPVFIDKNQYKTITYDINLLLGNITASIFTIYGESKKSLEFKLEKTVEISVLDVIDNSEIEVNELVYDKSKGWFIAVVKNPGNVDAFYQVELSNILLNGELKTFGSSVVKIKKGSVERIKIPVDPKLNEEDIQNNPSLHLIAHYGERERSLIKIYEKDFEYKEAGFSYITGRVVEDIKEGSILYIPIVVIIVLIILIIRAIHKKKKKEGEGNE